MSNCIIKTVNYFNPFSNQFIEASKDFSDLTLNRKILAVAAGIFGGLITPFLLFTGSFAGFQFAVKWLKQGDNNVSDRTNQTAHQTGVFPPPHSETDSLDTPTQEAPVNTAVREFGPREDLGEFSGIGKKTYEDESTYEGEFHQGLPHGQGKGTFPDGAVYKGGFVKGYFEGEGVLTIPGENGYFYKGGFQQGLPHGQGEGTFSDGTFYKGEFVKGNFEGEGVLTIPGENGSTHEGKFQQNLPHGQGKRTFPDGAVYEGEFVEGNFEGKGVFSVPGENGYFYEGEFSKNLFEGNGSLKYPDGRVYQGIFHDSLPIGKGKYTDKEGIKREGEFISREKNHLEFQPDGSTEIETIPCPFTSV